MSSTSPGPGAPCDERRVDVGVPGAGARHLHGASTPRLGDRLRSWSRWWTPGSIACPAKTITDPVRLRDSLHRSVKRRVRRGRVRAGGGIAVRRGPGARTRMAGVHRRARLLDLRRSPYRRQMPRRSSRSCSKAASGIAADLRAARCGGPACVPRGPRRLLLVQLVITGSDCPRQGEDRCSVARTGGSGQFDRVAVPDHRAGQRAMGRPWTTERRHRLRNHRDPRPAATKVTRVEVSDDLVPHQGLKPAAWQQRATTPCITERPRPAWMTRPRRQGPSSEAHRLRGQAMPVGNSTTKPSWRRTSRSGPLVHRRRSRPRSMALPATLHLVGRQHLAAKGGLHLRQRLAQRPGQPRSRLYVADPTHRSPAADQQPWPTRRASWRRRRHRPGSAGLAPGTPTGRGQVDPPGGAIQQSHPSSSSRARICCDSGGCAMCRRAAADRSAAPRPRRRSTGGAQFHRLILAESRSAEMGISRYLSPTPTCLHGPPRTRPRTRGRRHRRPVQLPRFDPGHVGPAGRRAGPALHRGAPDLRGHGLSPVVERTDSIDDLVDDVLALLDDLGSTGFISPVCRSAE